MAEKIVWSIKVQVEDGPTVSGSGEMLLEAYDKADILVKENQEKTLDVLPGDPKTAQLVMISSDNFKDLSCTIDPEANNNKGEKTIALSAPVLLIGEGPVGLLGSIDKPLKFSNASTKEARITVLVGRIKSA